MTQNTLFSNVSVKLLRSLSVQTTVQQPIADELAQQLQDLPTPALAELIKAVGIVMSSR
jgi:hypothetical protein